MGKSILIVEDDLLQASNISAFLSRHGWEVQACSSGEHAMNWFEFQRPDCIVADHQLPGMTGIEMLQKLRAIDPGVKCIVMTGDERAQTAVQAMKAGAYDYIVKPIVLAELNVLLERAIGVARMEQALQFHQDREARGSGLHSLIGKSAAMQRLKTTIAQLLEAEERVDDGDLPAVLIVGETGAGKELVARALHFDGRRRKGPFVEVNCASIPAQLLEAELFGHERGAFTDAKERRVGLAEAADGGTLFLDEIGEISLPLQAKLLKLLEEKTVRRVGSSSERRVDLRIISATNRDLQAMVKQGTFRSDLYFRLRIIPIDVPPLRARDDDILPLARHFLAVHSRRYGKLGLQFSVEAEEALVRYEWPGNVREMRNMLEEAVLLAPDDVITPRQLTLCRQLAAPQNDDEATAPAEPRLVIRTRAEHVDRSQMLEALQTTRWNVTLAALLLGLSRDTMRYRMEKMSLSRPAGQRLDNG